MSENHDDKRSFNQINEEITSNLTGVSAVDTKYLAECGQRYKSHPDKLEILRHVGRLLADAMPENEREEFEAAYKADLKRIESLLVQASNLVRDGQFAEANKLLSDANLDDGLSEHLFPEDDESLYLGFDNALEHAFYQLKHKPAKTLRPAVVPFKLSYSLAAFLAVENHQYDKALRILNTGIARCPLAADLIYERCEVYKARGMLSELYSSMQDNLQCLYQQEHIARYFRNLGYYFVDKKEWEPAIACYGVSMQWQRTESAARELGYITQTSGIKVDVVIEKINNFKEAQRILAERSIKIVPADPLWMQVSWHLGEQAEQSGNYQFAAECFLVHHGLTQSDEAQERFQKCVDRAKQQQSTQ